MVKDRKVCLNGDGLSKKHAKTNKSTTRLHLTKKNRNRNAWLMQSEWLETPKEHARTRIRRNDEKLFTGSQLNWIKDLQVVDKERKAKMEGLSVGFKRKSLIGGLKKITFKKWNPGNSIIGN
jgi:hypothetical protein